MSDGGGESGKEYDPRETRKRLGSDDFVNAIAKISVAQVCEGAGFQGFQQSALNTLSDVAVRYIREIGKTGSFYANLAGRSESNVFDIIQGLEDLGLPQGFAGASDINHCLASSGIVREIAQYVSDADAISFAYSIPSFPVIRHQKTALTFAQARETPPSDHIPVWLPAFPDPKAYSQDERGIDFQTDKIEPIKDQRKVESTLLNLQQHMSCNGSEPSAVDPGDAAKAKQAAESNPFLATPLRFGEKKVSSLMLPPKLLDEVAAKDSENHDPLLEAFSPLAQTLYDSEEGREKVFPNIRPTVQFKLKTSKKSSGTPLNLKLDDSDKMICLSGDNNDENKRKRRGEQILKEAMDNVEESGQL